MELGLRSDMRKSLTRHRTWGKEGQGRGIYCCKLLQKAPATFLETCVIHMKRLPSYNSNTWLCSLDLKAAENVQKPPSEGLRGTLGCSATISWWMLCSTNHVSVSVFWKGQAESQVAKLCSDPPKPEDALRCHVGKLSHSAACPVYKHYT